MKAKMWLLVKIRDERKKINILIKVLSCRVLIPSSPSCNSFHQKQFKFQKKELHTSHSTISGKNHDIWNMNLSKSFTKAIHIFGNNYPTKLATLAKIPHPYPPPSPDLPNTLPIPSIHIPCTYIPFTQGRGKKWREEKEGNGRWRVRVVKAKGKV